jgi:hypothetical protein
MEVSDQLHTPAALSPVIEPLIPLDSGLGGPQSRSGCFAEEKNLSLPGLELRPRSRSAHSAVIPTELHRLLLCTICFNSTTSILWPLSLFNVFVSVCLWLYSPLLDLGRFFSFFILYTVGRTPWTGDQPVASPLSTHRTTQTE